MEKLYKILLFLVPIYLVIYLLWMITLGISDDTVTFIGNNLSLLGVLVAAVCIFLTYRKSAKMERKFWLLIFLGTSAYVLADVAWIYYESILGVGIPAPGLPDYLYLTHGILYIVAMLVLTYKQTGLYYGFQMILDMLITGTVVLTLGWHFLIYPAFVVKSNILSEIIVSLSYIVIDLVLLCGYLYIYLGRKIRLNKKATAMFMLGLGIYISADFYYLFLTYNGTYHLSRWIDPFWVLGLMIIGLAGIKNIIETKKNTVPAEERSSLLYDRIRLIVPYLGITVLFVVLLVHMDSINSLFIGITLIMVLGIVRQIMVLIQNKELIKSLQIANRELNYLSRYNKLTGLYNRMYFDEELRRLQHSTDFPITIMVCDLDGLKLINDTMGHEKGDLLLIACSNLLKTSLRNSDIVARIGGDEFAAILTKTEQSSAEELVKKIKKNVLIYNQNNKELPMSLSIGISTTESKDFPLEQLLKEADDKMYNEKLIQKKSSKSQIIDSLMAALEERDHITEGHAHRVAEYCVKMGEQLNLSSNIITNLALLAQVHDLGKVGIPDSILFKEGPLTDEEWKIMRQHPEKGYRIAIASNNLVNVADLILKHHERWDGKGYPLGLKEKEIPIECRILAIVDSFDAITSKRPYKEARSTEEALKELQRCSGTQFDPELVQLFLELINTDMKGVV